MVNAKAVSRPPTVRAAHGLPRRGRIVTGALVLFMCCVTAIMLYPFGFMIDTSLKTQAQFNGDPGHSLESWARLTTAMPVMRELLNSTIVSVASIVIIGAVASFAGFAFAKLRYRFATPVFLGIIAAMLIPMQSIIIPAYVNLARFHLVTGYWAAILVYAALGTPFATFLMTTYYRGLPGEIIEAAVIDGCGHFRAFWRVGLPLAKPALATVAVLQFVQIWDDLLIGLLFLQDPAHRTITVGLGVLASGRTTDIPVLMAGSIVSAIPAILVYLIFQRQLVRGLTAGMAK